jgi:hypothetical protein
VVQASVWLDFDEGSAGEGAVVTTAANNGLWAVDSSWGVRLPVYSGVSDPPRAVVRIRASDTSDPLSPRTSEFEFGADFRLDATSTGSTVDNGDNLIQRGLFRDRGQYKLEVDAGKLACRVKGATGQVTVRSPVSISRGAWYRAFCRRAGTQVVLKVARIISGGLGTFTSTTANGGTGDVDMGGSVPLSAGGKLSADGLLVLAATDQFNGIVDRVFYRRL